MLRPYRVFAIKAGLGGAGLTAGLGGAGLTAGLVGMATKQRWLVWVAVGLLGVAFLLRFAEKKTP